MLREVVIWLSVVTLVKCDQRCWECSNEGSLAVCQETTVACPASEQCFVEKVVTDSNEVVFNAGCRSNTACVIMQSLSAGAVGKRSISLCGKCCTGPHCQDTLCGLNPGGPSQLRCLSCSSVTSPADCLVYETCQDRKVCYAGIHIEYSSLRYSFGCQDKHLCQNSAANDVVGHPGREVANGQSICDACCDSDYCNKVDCYILKKNMTNQMFATG
ncbi:uncharacterized protein LOC110447803 [Mizuhopecten yessoensis]|uniref:uncharacterized protein LOC110447803 n=1 Tax=Mizuhopecten yessoensis TaxID=6573 RepID=UPI000B45DAD9|nr:uncharacterized protein LOC110447803 [Mizuhopecten yessoensis]